MSERNTLNYVRDCIDMEGFDYAIQHYSNFEEVESEEFHAKRKAYIAAANDLASFLGVDP